MSDASATQIFYETRELCHRDVYKHLSDLRKSLVELKAASKKALIDNRLHWQNEIERVKQEKDREWLQKMNLAKAESTPLQIITQDLTGLEGSKVDPRLSEAEDQIEKLSRELDDKVIHINRLQIALAEKTQAIYELEKSCALLCLEYKRLQHREKKYRSKKSESKSESP